MGTLATKTLTREALRASPARVRVIGGSDSWFIMERGSESSVPVKRDWQLYESAPRSMRTVLSGPRARINLKQPGPPLNYPLVAHYAPLLAHQGKCGMALPSYPRRGCSTESKTKKMGQAPRRTNVSSRGLGARPAWVWRTDKSCINSTLNP
jgi:hypothetical protein